MFGYSSNKKASLRKERHCHKCAPDGRVPSDYPVSINLARLRARSLVQYRAGGGAESLTRNGQLQRLAAGKMSSQTPTPETLSPVAPDVYERLCRAREFIDLCYDLPLNLDQISSQACFSRFHFLRLFREAFAKTPHQYLVERRIEKAKELLTSDHLRVTDICFEVGFQSLGSFSSLFRKSVGQPPVLFREKARASVSARRQIPGCFLVMYKLEPTN